MKRNFIIITIAITAISLTLKNVDVYVCNGKSIGKYHYSKTCKGLNSCKYEIVQMSLESAKTKGYTICAWED